MSVANDALFDGRRFALLPGDARAVLETLPAASVHVCVTSPPYFGLRAYAGTVPIVWGGDRACVHTWGTIERGKRKDILPADVTKLASRTGTTALQDGAATDGGRFCTGCGAWRGCLGNEPEPALYIEHLVVVLRAVRRVLRPDGLLYLNLGESFAGGGNGGGGSYARDGVRGTFDKNARPDNRRGGLDVPPGFQSGDLLGIPFRAALALQADGWIWRQTIVWAKDAPMPESVSGWRWERCRRKVAPGAVARDGLGGSGQSAHGDTISDRTGACAWEPCPGCPRCAKNDGLILRTAKWRPTTAHEYVFLLAPSEDYIADAEGAAEPAAPESASRYKYAFGGQRSEALTEAESLGPGSRTHPIGERQFDGMRNPRSVWNLGPEPAAWDFCLGCKTFFCGQMRSEIRTVRAGKTKVRHCPACKATDRWVDHYALMAPALVAKCLAAIPAAVCAACGAPWVRVVDRVRTLDGEEADLGMWRSQDPAAPSGAQGVGHGRIATFRHARGWRPTCACPPAPPVAPIALDPFCGAGTTGLEALRRGMRFVGIDLSPSYLALAEARLGAPESEAAQLAAVREAVGQLRLFGEEDT